MTIDTSNPNKLPWPDLPREVKAEMALQMHVEGATAEWFDGDAWYTNNLPASEWREDIYRIRPAEERETVTEVAWILGEGHRIRFETVNGKIDKSVQPGWVE